ncbi:DUF1294 domain-containing protein [Anaerosporobacter faecicola]|uniref:DUF1294 domain-containing protein n=1 Tax=Anaerosporobacter faecicola TaxID=2718714 RepID=UPI001A9AB3AB|nr:DUF1294 domain-containing protein [Anaerosporobacter faecicola]
MKFIENNYIVIIGIYVLLCNCVGFAIMGIDKSKAKRGAWRIPEKTLFLVALLGGSIGTILGMQKFRHKTKHKSFVYGMPAILILQLILVIYFGVTV